MKTKDYLYKEWKKHQQNRRYYKNDPVESSLLWMQVIFVLMGITVVSGIFGLIIRASLNW